MYTAIIDYPIKGKILSLSFFAKMKLRLLPLNKVAIHAVGPRNWKNAKVRPNEMSFIWPFVVLWRHPHWHSFVRIAFKVKCMLCSGKKCVCACLLSIRVFFPRDSACTLAQPPMWPPAWSRVLHAVCECKGMGIDAWLTGRQYYSCRSLCRPFLVCC